MRPGKNRRIASIQNCLIISSERAARQGWEEAFRAHNSASDELMLEATEPSEFDRKEWRW